VKKYPPPAPTTRTQWLFGFRSLVENQIWLMTWSLWATASKCLDILGNKDIFTGRWIIGRLMYVSSPTPFDQLAVKLNGVSPSTLLPHIAFFFVGFLFFYPPKLDTRYEIVALSVCLVREVLVPPRFWILML